MCGGEPVSSVARSGRGHLRPSPDALPGARSQSGTLLCSGAEDLSEERHGADGVGEDDFVSLSRKPPHFLTWSPYVQCFAW